MRNLEDNEIIESVKKGNHSDFSILIDRYKNKAFSLLKRMIKNEMEAEEVLQDCFLKAFKGLNSFKKESKFSTWFYKIVYNTALTKISSKKRKVETEMTSLEQHFDLKSEVNYGIAEKEDISNFINKIIDKLPENYAAVTNLFYLEGMSCEEISETMNISLSNVKVMLYRSRNQLKDIIVKNDYLKELL